MIIKRKKRFALSLLATLLFMYFFFPLYISKYQDDLFRAYCNREARTEFFLSGKDAKNLELLSHTLRGIDHPKLLTDDFQKTHPELVKNGYAKIHHSYKNFQIQLKVHGDGKLRAALTAPNNTWDDGKYFPVWVYYESFKINGIELLDKEYKVNYKNPFVHEFNVKDGEELTITFRAKRDMMVNILQGVDLCYFITFLIISYLLGRMLVYWLAKFKLFEHHSRIDIVFLCVFFLILLLPISNIDKNEKSEYENRMLATYKPLVVTGGGINQKYGKDFENWFNDHFFGRRLVIRNYNKFIFGIKSIVENHKAFLGKEHWAFTKTANSIANFQHKNLFTEAELEQIVLSLNDFRSWLKSQNIDFYLMMTPDKESVYPEYYSDFYKQGKGLSRLQQTYKYITENTDIKVIFPYQALWDDKVNHRLYHKIDTHWNARGAYIGYKELMRALNKDYPELKAFAEKDFDITPEVSGSGDLSLALDLDLSKDFTKEDITNDVLNIKNPQTSKERFIFDKERLIIISAYTNSQPKKYSSVILGDSFTGGFDFYFAEHFKNFKYIFFGGGYSFNVDYTKESILADKPDFVVLQSTERFIDRFLDLNLPEVK